MNKYLSYLIFLILFNYCINADNDEIQGITECSTDGQDCEERTPSNPLYKCQKGQDEACTAVPKTCEEAKSISSMDGVDCKILSTNNAICITGTTGCIEPKTCNEVISDADDTMCGKFSDSINKCNFIETEGEVKAHCQSSIRGCTETLEASETNKENSCSSRSTSEKICYFNGNDDEPACKEASKCEDIQLSEGKKVAQTTCDKYNPENPSANSKCVAVDNKCLSKSFCEYGTKTSEYDCSDYALKDPEKVCVLKQKSETECEEITKEENEERQEQPPTTTECNAAESTVACSTRKVSSTIKKCTQTSKDGETLTCTEENKTCEEAKTLTDIECSQLSTEKNLCITGKSGCITPTTCDEVISDATNAICKSFEDVNNKCEYIAANTAGETNTKAHCKSVAKTCTDSLGDVSTGQEEICTKRPKSEGAICYFDGNSACKEASKCEDIVFSLGKTVLQTTCNTYNKDTTAQKKCVAEDNKCVLKSYCDDGKTSEHECSYYELKTEGNVCVLKQDSTTECKEYSQADYQARLDEQANGFCQGKSEAECKLTFANTFFVKCELEGKECKSKLTYGTCSSAASLSEATNEQCSKLTHSSNTFCIKGISGCVEVESCEGITGADTLTDAICNNFPVPSFQECVEGTGTCTLKTKKCTDQSIIYEEGICGLLETTSANQKCYYNGAKCSEATSCETITDTTLTGNSLKAVCAQFNTVTENCVPDGKKCKLVEKSESEEEEEEKKENEGSKTCGSSLDKALTLSFAILILVLVL